MSDHALTEGHTIGCDDATVLAKLNGFYNLVNGDDGHHISRTWKPALVNNQDETRRKASSQNASLTRSGPSTNQLKSTEDATCGETSASNQRRPRRSIEEVTIDICFDEIGSPTFTEDFAGYFW